MERLVGFGHMDTDEVESQVARAKRVPGPSLSCCRKRSSKKGFTLEDELGDDNE